MGGPRAGSAQRNGFFVVGDSVSGGWNTALEAVGYRSGSAATAAIYVVRPGAALPVRDWRTLVAEGAYLVIEGGSPLAAQFGFTPKVDSVTTRREPTCTIRARSSSGSVPSECRGPRCRRRRECSVRIAGTVSRSSPAHESAAAPCCRPTPPFPLSTAHSPTLHTNPPLARAVQRSNIQISSITVTGLV
jgi:hypothetical protein